MYMFSGHLFVQQEDPPPPHRSPLLTRDPLMCFFNIHVKALRFPSPRDPEISYV